MVTDIEIVGKGALALFDRAANEPPPPRGDAFVLDREYVDTSRMGRLFFYEPLDNIVGSIRLYLDDSPDPALRVRASTSVSGLLLSLPSGTLEIGTMWCLAADRPRGLRSARMLEVTPGDYRLDAWLLNEPAETEMNGPAPLKRALRFQGLVIGTSAWLAFCTVCYGALVTYGLAGEALGIYVCVGVAPLLVAVALFYATGSRAELAAVARVAPDCSPDVIVSLARVVTGEAPLTGGGLVHPML